LVLPNVVVNYSGQPKPNLLVLRICDLSRSIQRTDFVRYITRLTSEFRQTNS